jgi:hypothetical protein
MRCIPLQGIPGDDIPLHSSQVIAISVTNVNDVSVRGFTDTTVLPTAGGGHTVLHGSNLGRVSPLSGAGVDGMGPDATLSYGGSDGRLYALTTIRTCALATVRVLCSVHM